jgi:hypothetical protein
MRIALSALLILATAGQAAALRCIQPDPVRTFLQVDADPGNWIVLKGTLDYEHPLTSTDDLMNPPPAYPPVAGQFEGLSLTGTGFDRPYAGPMWLAVTCAGPWCGVLPGPGEAIYFAELTADGPVIRFGPCGGESYAPTREIEAALTSCLAGGACEQTF